MSSSRHNDSMEPLHNSTLRPSSRRGKTVRNNTTMSASRNQGKNNGDMMCFCFNVPPTIMNKMSSNSNDCNCTCHMNHMNNMDFSGIDLTFEMSENNRSKQRDKSSLQELEESTQSMSNDFQETILEVANDPSNAVPLGRFYRVNSFR